MPAALIFDIDGTFAETEELHRHAFNQTFKVFRLDWHWNRPLYRKLLAVAGGKERLAHYVTHYVPHDAERVDVAALHAAKTARYADMVAEGSLCLRPGIARLLGEAERLNIKVAIATTTSLPNVETLLQATLGGEVIDAFSAIGAGDVVAAKKPAPDVYSYVLERLGCEGRDCIAFEDSYNGLSAARGAGIPTVVTPSYYTDSEDFGGALAVLSDLGEPGAPYRHFAGTGDHDVMVTIETLARWREQRA